MSVRLTGALVAVGLVIVVTLASRSERPGIAGDGVSLTPVWVVVAGLGVALVAGLLFLVLSGRRTVPDAPDVPSLRRLAVGLALVLAAASLAPWIAGEGGLDLAPPEQPAPVTPTEPSEQPPPLGPSPTATAAGILAVLLAVAAVLVRLGWQRRHVTTAGSAPPTQHLTTPDAPAVDLDPDPRGDPRTVVLAAYEAARRLVAPTVGALPSSPPLALVRNASGSAAVGAFAELTWIYLPVRFGAAHADEARRDAALELLHRIRRAVPG